MEWEEKGTHTHTATGLIESGFGISSTYYHYDIYREDVSKAYLNGREPLFYAKYFTIHIGGVCVSEYFFYYSLGQFNTKEEAITVCEEHLKNKEKEKRGIPYLTFEPAKKVVTKAKWWWF